MPLFLPIVWIIAGFTLAAGVWCISGNIRAQHTAFLPFGVLAILIAADLALTAEYYSLDSLKLMKLVYDLRNILICIIFPVAVWFIGTYTRVRKLSSWVATCAVIYTGFLIAYVWSGGDWFFTNWTMEPSFVFLGERLSWANNTGGPLLVYFSSTHDAVFVWALWRCAAMWYAGLHYKALPLTIYFLLQATAVISDQLMGAKNEPFVQLGQFAFLGLVVIMGVSLILETRRREEAFFKTVGALQAESAKRKRYEARLNYLATHDPLTDLPNRRQLRTILDTTLQQY